ncbi:MAG: undecaprenyl-diphosphate phosphatase [Promethearchaeota archaeon]|nr:MAG: undecaprenyl-diphosphate phosphatase [Candidatus Lokiarchaeota archaeon]
MFEYYLLAILQGLFEWLPISSEGQTMVIAINGFGISEANALSLAIFLHLGTTLAVIVKFRKEIIRIIRAAYPNPPPDVTETDTKMRNWVIFGTIGTAVTAIPLYFLIKESFTAFQGDLVTLFIAGFLLLTGVLLLLSRNKFGNNTLADVPQGRLTTHSVITGIIQGTAILPGISRSGITVSANLFENYEQNTALRLSFLMSIPVSLAAIALDFLTEGSVFTFLDPLTVIILTAISFAIGYLTIAALLRLARKIQFGYFCIVYAVITFAVILPFLLL